MLKLPRIQLLKFQGNSQFCLNVRQIILNWINCTRDMNLDQVKCFKGTFPRAENIRKNKVYSKNVAFIFPSLIGGNLNEKIRSNNDRENWQNLFLFSFYSTWLCLLRILSCIRVHSPEYIFSRVVKLSEWKSENTNFNVYFK